MTYSRHTRAIQRLSETGIAVGTGVGQVVLAMRHMMISSEGRSRNVDRASVLERLNAETPALKERYGLRSLAVFGSVARGDDHETSDVDILATFEGRVTFDRYMGLKLELEDLLGRPVDLGTPQTLRPELRDRIAKDLIHVA